MMKKIIYGLLLSVLCLAGVKAQTVDSYKFASSTGTYTALTDGTALTQIPTDGTDVASFVYDATSKVAVDNVEEDAAVTKNIPGIDMGFDFKFGGETYRKFAVTGYGYVIFGKAGTDIEFTAYDLDMVQMKGIAAAAGTTTDGPIRDLKVDYAVTGTDGAKVLTVQFANINYGTEAVTDKMDYQLRFHENGTIEMIFKGHPGLSSTPEGMDNFGVGLSTTNFTHFRDRGWNSSYAETELATAVSYVGYSGLKPFPAGLTYTFSLPDPCADPTYAVHSMAFTSTSTSIDLSIEVDAQDKVANSYMIVASQSNITGKPADGTAYKKDDEAFGGMVIAVGETEYLDETEEGYLLIEETHEKLAPNTQWYYAVYFANTGECKSKFTEPTVESAKTSTSAPAELKLKSASTGELVFSAKANELNEEIAILMGLYRRYENSNQQNKGHFCDVPSNAQAGDKYGYTWTYGRNDVFKDTTYVLYVGSAKEEIKCPVNLQDNRVYFFAAVSKGANGEYSTQLSDAEPYLTPAVLPFSDNIATNLTWYQETAFLGGWAGTTNFEITQSSRKTDGVKSVLDAPGEAVLVIPALDFPTDSNVLVEISSQLSGYELKDRVEGDSIALEISINGGKTFKTLKAVHKETDNMALGKVIVRDYLGAKQAVLRLRVKNANTTTDKNLNIKVSSIKITALPFCPEPGKPKVSSTRVYGGTLGLTWTASVNNETQWNISTAAAAAVAEGQEAAWSRPALVTEKSYYLTGLADQEVYNVRIQAVCEGGRTSGWVEAQVQAGRVPSFTEDFNTEKEPANWQFGYAYKSSPTSWYTSFYSNYAKYYQYMTKAAATEGNGALAFDMQHYYISSRSGSYNYNYLIQTPMVELNPAEKPQLKFDAAFGSWVNDEFVAMPAESQKDTMRLALWVCDSGRFDIKNAPAKEWKVAELATWNAGKAFTIDLSEFVTEAKVVSVVMAIFTEPVAGTEAHMLYLDNIGIVNTEPLARSVKVAALGAEEATIQWVADKTVEKWLVKLEGGSLTSPRFFTDVVGNMQVIDGLEAEQTYTASVTPAGNGQEAAAERWVSVGFTTLAASCPEPTALSVSNVEQRTAVLSWEGEAAEGYYVHYRPVAAQGAEVMPWISVRVNEGTTYTLSGLTPGTAYECEVEGICSEVAEFYSERVALEGGFETKAITCFAPTELRCPEATLTHKSAVVSWTGTSAGYQVAWTVQNSNNWTYSAVVSEAAYTIKGLDYNSWYTFKVRGVCSAGDSSEWSETRNFRTLARPACANPTNLRVESLTQTSADLKWDYAEADEGDLASFTLRHREASVQAWDSIKEVEGTTYAIKDMKPKTAYVWNVMAICQDDRNSEWLNLRFTTLEEPQDTVPTPPTDTTAIEDLKLATGLYVAAAQGQIHVMNPKSVRIDNIRIYGLSGQRLEQYAIRSTDHVILTTAVRQRVAIVEVESEGRFIRFKVMLP